MFAYIKGTLVAITSTKAVIELNGIGFEVNASSNTLARLPALGKEVKLSTYLYLREDEVALYGFLTEEEKGMFLKLITISGIGPKAATGILSGMELSTLAVAIVTGDVKAISKIKGVGKKTAERIVLELKEKLSAEESEYTGPAIQMQSADGLSSDAINALRTLGIGQSEAMQAVAKARATSSTLEELIMNALRSLNK